MLSASGTIYVKRPRNHTPGGLKWLVNESDKVELAFRLWQIERKLLVYEDGDNAMRIQRVGIPGLQAEF